MLTDKELRSEFEAALEAVTPPSPWLGASIEKAWRATQRTGWRRRATLGFRISMRLAAVAVLVALVLAGTALFLAIHLATNTAPAMPRHTQATSRAVWGMVSATTGWQETSSFDTNGWHHILRTTDGGAHWKDVGPPESLTKGIDPAVTPTINEVLYVLDANHVWLVVAPSVPVPPVQGSLAPQGLVTIRTTDGGQTWERGTLLAMTVRGNFFSVDFVDASHGWLLRQSSYDPTFSGEMLFSTVDGGLNWRLVSSQPNGGEPRCFWNWIAFASRATGWASVQCSRVANDQILVTRDGGTTWSNQPLPVAANETPSEPPVVFDKDHALLVADNGQLQRRLLMTSDAGGSWSERALPGEEQFLVNFIDPMHGWTVAGPGIWFNKTAAGLPNVSGVALPLYRTDDGGLTWSPVRTSVNLDSSQGRVTNLYFVDQRNGFLERTSLTGKVLLFRTTDGGQTWAIIGPAPPQ